MRGSPPHLLSIISWQRLYICYELTKGEMGRCGSFKDSLSHGLTGLALHVVEGIIAGKHKWKLMSFLIKVSCFYLTKHKTVSYGSSFGCHQ